MAAKPPLVNDCRVIIGGHANPNLPNTLGILIIHEPASGTNVLPRHKASRLHQVLASAPGPAPAMGKAWDQWDQWDQWDGPSW